LPIGGGGGVGGMGGVTGPPPGLPLLLEPPPPPPQADRASAQTASAANRTIVETAIRGGAIVYSPNRAPGAPTAPRMGKDNVAGLAALTRTPKIGARHGIGDILLFRAYSVKKENVPNFIQR